MSIVDRIKEFWKSGFTRSVVVLVGGSAFSQAISVLILPLLTRLYSPDDFGVLAVYAAIMGVLTAIACLRFEVAIPIASDDKEAVCLLVLALGSAAAISLLLLGAVLLVPGLIVELSGQARLADYLFFIPIGALLVGGFSAFQYWAIRRSNFKVVARTRLFQSLGSSAAQLGLGVGGASPLGLILGYVINVGAGSLGLWRAMRHQDGVLFKEVSSQKLLAAFKKYDRFPKMSAIEALANSAGIQIPVIIVASYALGKEAGFLLLAMRVMQVPLGVIGQAVAQVYLSRAPEEHRKENLKGFTLGVFSGLFRAGVGPLIFVGAVSPVLFGLVFGREWERAGDLVLWMTAWYVLQFLASPLSMALQVTNHQGLALGLQVFGLVLRVSSVATCAFFLSDGVSEVYALSGAVFYACYLAVIMRVLAISLADLLEVIKNSFSVLLAWFFLAGTIVGLSYLF